MRRLTTTIAISALAAASAFGLAACGSEKKPAEKPSVSQTNKMSDGKDKKSDGKDKMSDGKDKKSDGKDKMSDGKDKK
ncbi:Uncharacterised protein [Actinomyces bovis]|uniref:Pentapeptide MXKDX repeat protein n=1 Tax=Actinomyces bovis TaxID=1658 RepID=A0ABY1VMC1_9ACTO|nr:hypothetical protein [Actinomyces bovis]SPT53235.1 Uncharacterised protein [Actinomyces bovis]VEG52485.1 Uncharacterised protein [Actinomyces israelii]